MWGAAMDLGEWLKGLGLGQYEATFREHEIDADVLPDLTEADLEKIGLPLGGGLRRDGRFRTTGSQQPSASLERGSSPARSPA